MFALKNFYKNKNNLTLCHLAMEQRKLIKKMAVEKFERSKPHVNIGSLVTLTMARPHCRPQL
jgi:hypothetical protein